jgi:hypothetical protein
MIKLVWFNSIIMTTSTLVICKLTAYSLASLSIHLWQILCIVWEIIVLRHFVKTPGLPIVTIYLPILSSDTCLICWLFTKLWPLDLYNDLSVFRTFFVRAFRYSFDILNIALLYQDTDQVGVCFWSIDISLKLYGPIHLYL